MRETQLRHQFVEHLPERLEAGVLYISIEYATAAHCCCCGCGEEVVTPFSPTDWKMTFDGETVSLWPSIGNWSFACRSHYIIEHGRVIKAGNWTDEQVEANRQRDRAAKTLYYGTTKQADPKPPSLEPPVVPQPAESQPSFAKRWLQLFRSFWRR